MPLSTVRLEPVLDGVSLADALGFLGELLGFPSALAAPPTCTTCGGSLSLACSAVAYYFVGGIRADGSRRISAEPEVIQPTGAAECLCLRCGERSSLADLPTSGTL
jgi:hypothetical protein